ncbi:hypothetical protein PC9H_001701 [Pleurotus ostreatus]|uniref:Cyclase n=1 Tax=Pleurotus ostreatus TaxID=5322 RepID=A0A8H7DXR0_PLEOS|nr:uncharacterized protein PC9H_001701 [Pleurotus ostreatus]KAF7441352.1 hypothetical protein PC9H_001701 [Pleurotus ostreatus]
MAANRLKGVLAHLGASPKPLPTFDELPNFKEFPGCAWAVWGGSDQLGTINLLTDEVVKRAAQEEIRSGKSVCLNWPLNFPEKPMFNRKSPDILSKVRSPPGITRDDEIHINTQSGTQWDGLKHFGLIEHGVFYNNTPATELPIGKFTYPDPLKVDPEMIKLGIQNWAQHGICGRGVFLDLVKFFTDSEKALPYDPWATHGISVKDLEACAKYQGTQFRQGDILLLRVGFMQKYNRSTQAEKDALANKPETFAGIEQSTEMKRFLWDNHFAAIASDQPALERWPVPAGVPHMHQANSTRVRAKASAPKYNSMTIFFQRFSLWGMPIGEFFDLEKLSQVCAETRRYTFFFSSWPLNILGGCASPPNAAALF